MWKFYIKPIGRGPGREERKAYKERTPFFRKGKFHNAKEEPLMVRARRQKSSERVPRYPIPVVSHSSIKAAGEGKVCFYWLGHSSILLQVGGKNVLIDPVLTKYSSPFNWIGVKRFSMAPIAPKDLPDIDILLISHDHYDHLDYQTIMAIKDRVACFVVPLGVESFLKSWKIEEGRIRSLAWWESVDVDGLKITATPAQHFSTRNPIHSNASWWCGYCIECDGHTTYHSGDGGYSDSFREIGERFQIDLAFLECGQYDLAWPHCHMFPEETAQAAVDLKARWAVPVHWGAFCLCNSAWNDSVKRFRKMARKLGVGYAVPMIGECVSYDRIGAYDKAWYNLKSMPPPL